MQERITESITCQEWDQNQDEQQRRLAATSTVIIEFRWLCSGSLDESAGSLRATSNITPGFRFELMPQALAGQFGSTDARLLGTVSWK